jgi:hypothetical protein
VTVGFVRMVTESGMWLWMQSAEELDFHKVRTVLEVLKRPFASLEATGEAMRAEGVAGVEEGKGATIEETLALYRAPQPDWAADLINT